MMALLEQPKKKLRITIKCGKKRTTHEISFDQPYAQKGHSETTGTTTTNSLAQFLTSIANDDILFEVFTRLPNARAVHHCAAACKRWRSAISHPHFVPIFKRLHQNRSSPFTLLLRVSIGDRVLYPTAPRRRAFRELFSECSKTLHGPERSAGKTEYLDFLPQDSLVTASCKDLLLVELEPESRRMCVCNPLTRQWVPLPVPPILTAQPKAPFYRHEYLEIFRPPNPDIHHYALVCNPNSEHNHYAVVVSRKDSRQVIRASVFRSETGRWDEAVRTFTLGDGFYLLTMAVGTIEGAIYTLLAKDEVVKKILAFNPFDDTTGLECREISLPVGFKRGWRGTISRCRIGAVQGRLRLWQSYFDMRMDKFVFRAWQLDDEWVLVHELRLAMGNESKFTELSSVIALHPNNDDVFFFKDDSPSIWEYHIGTGSCKKIGEVDKMWSDSVVYTLVHPAWPTAFPQFNSI